MSLIRLERELGRLADPRLKRLGLCGGTQTAALETAGDPTVWAHPEAETTSASGGRPILLAVQILLNAAIIRSEPAG